MQSASIQEGQSASLAGMAMASLLVARAQGGGTRGGHGADWTCGVDRDENHSTGHEIDHELDDDGEKNVGAAVARIR